MGDTYTILVSGSDTAGRHCLIDMHVPPGGGPPPHRHDFEETFTILEGEIQLNFRGEQLVARAGQTINLPANAPHSFKNTSARPARLLCHCTPAGLDEMFRQLGDPVATRTAPPPQLSDAQKAERIQKSQNPRLQIPNRVVDVAIPSPERGCVGPPTSRSNMNTPKIIQFQNRLPSPRACFFSIANWATRPCRVSNLSPFSK